MRLYKFSIINEDKSLADIAICYARSKEDALKKFEKLYVVEAGKVEEVFFNNLDVAILTEY